MRWVGLNLCRNHQNWLYHQDGIHLFDRLLAGISPETRRSSIGSCCRIFSACAYLRLRRRVTALTFTTITYHCLSTDGGKNGTLDQGWSRSQSTSVLLLLHYTPLLIYLTPRLRICPIFLTLPIIWWPVNCVAGFYIVFFTAYETKWLKESVQNLFKIFNRSVILFVLIHAPLLGLFLLLANH